MRIDRLLGALAILLALAGLAAPAKATKRVALVIGNSAYQHTGILANPRNDAADIGAALRKLGFRVIEGHDLDKSAMDRSILEFARELSGAHVGLFFYAGHGLQVDGQNYLMPVGAKLEDAWSLDFEMIRLDLVHKTMERATKTNLIFLDACRDNPLTRNLTRALGTRSAAVGRGLAAVESGEGTLISFSTQPGNLAADGTGRNSPFAAALLKQLVVSRDDISTMLIGVRNDVIQATARRQVPWEHSALTARFYFSAPDASPPRSSYEQQAELAFWAAVKDSRNPAMIQGYLDRFPQGAFATIARLLVEQLRQEQQQAAMVAGKEAELRKAEAAKELAEQQRRETERKAAEARQSEELRKAQDEARKAREALAKADAEREVARKSAEDARKFAEIARLERAAAAKAAEAAQTRVAALPIPEPASVPSSGFDREALTRDLQRELKRVGCDAGNIDGRWGPKVRSALGDFAKRTKIALASDEPTTAALEAVTRQKGRICPLECASNKVERDGKCVPKPSTVTGASSPSTRAPKATPKSDRAESKKGPEKMCWSSGGWIKPCSELYGAASRPVD